MTAFIYVLFLTVMLYSLYLSGKELRRTGNLKSKAVIWGILLYTLNVGLRFGRGIDYNLYGQRYESFLMGGNFDYEIGFVTIAKLLSILGFSWQGFVLLMSFAFIFSSILFLKNYKLVVPYALPLFSLFSLSRVENMVRWYLGFSFLLVGLSYLIQRKDKRIVVYSFFCLTACCFHLALVPVCFLFYFLYKCEKVFFHPIVTIALFYSIGLFFQTDLMLSITDLINRYSMMLGDYAHYVDNADYWLAGGFAGAERNSFPGLTMQLLFIVVVVWGYKVVKGMSNNYIFAYNLFLIGYITMPIARQIELFSRYNAVFYFFIAIVYACVLYKLLIAKSIIVQPIALIFIILVSLNYVRFVISEPFKGNKDHYLYVWDRGDRTYDEMYDTWIDDLKYSNSN